MEPFARVKTINVRAGLTLPAGENFSSKRVDIEIGVEVDAELDAEGEQKVSGYIDSLAILVKRKVNETIRRQAE